MTATPSSFADFNPAAPTVESLMRHMAAITREIELFTAEFHVWLAAEFGGPDVAGDIGHRRTVREDRIEELERENARLDKVIREAAA